MLFTPGTGDAQIGMVYPSAVACRGLSVRRAERVNGSINQINASITGITQRGSRA
jgi:hypothetical protein